MSNADQRAPQALYSTMLAANPQYGPIASEYTPIVEDLQWEEPDLTGLAPFIPDDDVVSSSGDRVQIRPFLD